jgi:bla regulator protein BlaR1
MRKDCELCCDAFTLSKLKEAQHKQYGQTLIKLVEVFSKQKWAPGTASIINKHEIKRRIIMISKFKKKSLLWTILAFALVTAIGCSVLTDSKNETKSTDTKVATPATNNATNSNDTKGSDDSTSSSAAATIKPSSVDGETLLKQIYALARKGKITNSEFISKTSIYEDITAKLGKPDKIDAAGAGRYATYTKQAVAFGLNKGDQVFDVRSYSPDLKKIKYSYVTKILGTPGTINHYNKQDIIIYNISSEYELMLIFPTPNKANADPVLDHTSVYSPQAARNLMAEDTNTKNRYDVAGISDPKAFESAFNEVKALVAKGDKAKVADYIKYPINAYIDGTRQSITSKDQFIKNYDKIFTSKVRTAFLNQDVSTTFVNYQGVMVGNGELWFSVFDNKFLVYGINNDI